jgi:signal transduction histidine kinase
MLNNASTVEPAAQSKNAASGTSSVWIANYAGLSHFDPATKRFRLWDRNRGLPINAASAIIVADDSSCWISTRAGLVHGTPFDDTLGLRFRTYNAADGLQSTDFSGLSRLKTRDGHFLFGTVTGLVEFDPKTLTDNQDKPPVLLTGFQVFNRDIALDTDLATITTIPLDYRENVVGFEFAALNYIRPEWNRYAYKLDGFDQEWVYCGNKHEAHYTNLDPGTYRFIVRAMNNDGVWSDKFVSVALVIAPPFWRTTWFMALVTAILIASLYVSHKLRVRHIHERNRILEEQVKERTHVVAAQRDELQKAYEHLQHAQVQLVQSEKMASLGQLTAGIAHEINNPINFISGNIEPLKRDLEDVLSLMRDYEALLHTSNDQAEIDRLRAALEKKREELQIPALLEEVAALMKGMQEGATRTSTIVRGLRNFSRLDQNALKEVDIEEGLESTIALVESRWRGRIVIQRDYDQNARRIECYPGELNQVFMNLLSNAIEAIPHSGTIRIATERQADLVKITVKDSGEGIDAVTLSRIFEPFFTTKPVGTGTGLGLSISYGIIQKHHGTIELESTPGAGTTAIVTLPVAQTTSERHPERSEGSRLEVADQVAVRDPSLRSG